MNKLLLLVTCLLGFALHGNAIQQEGGATSPAAVNDSNIKQPPTTDPKEAFKDLFQPDQAFTAGVNVSKLNPKAVSFVQDYMEDHTAGLEKMKDWGKPYFDMMNAVLAQNGIPVEMKYLSVIESNLKPGAVSWAGAVGPWQFMPATAKTYGLRVDRYADERTDFVKSTGAAARYLKKLYSIYNDWLLVIASYNCGPGRVNSAIKRSGSRNFWDMEAYLPTESRNHVKKFIATHYIMEGDGGLTTVTAGEQAQVYASNEGMPVTTISGKYHSAAIAQMIQMDIQDFRKLNPDFDSQLSVKGSYELHLPPGKMELFNSNKLQILDASIRILFAMAG